MDIKELKQEVTRYIAAMTKDGKDFSFVALIPAYSGLMDTPYIIQVKADWIDKVGSYKDVLHYMIPKMFKVLKLRTRKCIFRIDIFDDISRVHCMSKDLILINKIDYDPAEYREQYV